MSTYHVTPFGGQAEVWELMDSGTMAMLVATFTHDDDAQLFADLKNGLRRDNKNFVFENCTFTKDEDVPELGPDEFVLVDEEQPVIELTDADVIDEMYECHLTYDNVDEAAQRSLEEFAAHHGWKTSFIEGDPALGPGLRFFLTAHAANPHDLYNKMVVASITGPRQVVRQKIESIVHDTKYGKEFPWDPKKETPFEWPTNIWNVADMNPEASTTTEHGENL